MAPEAYCVLPAVGVNRRAGPGLAAEVLGALPAGAVVRALGPLSDADGLAWRQCAEGWIADPYLRRIPWGGELDPAAEARFTFGQLWPVIAEASAPVGAPARVVLAIAYQESGFRNWRVHHDGTGHGLFGLDDNGLVPSFEAWSGMEVGRGLAAAVIPPGLQVEFAARTLAEMAQGYGDAYTAARAWHRGPTYWRDERGASYERLIRAHVAQFFGVA